MGVTREGRSRLAPAAAHGARSAPAFATAIFMLFASALVKPSRIVLTGCPCSGAAKVIDEARVLAVLKENNMDVNVAYDLLHEDPRVFMGTCVYRVPAFSSA